MANILDRYGIKEVADVTFYELQKDGSVGAPVLYLDTLKVSTIEQTAEQAEARGGKGNPPLVIWDYGKEITVTLEDALFSARSMAIMFGDGDLSTEKTSITKTVQYTHSADNTADPYVENGWEGPGSKKYEVSSVKYYSIERADDVEEDENGGGLEREVAFEKLVAGNTYYATLTLNAKTINVIDISANSFPGTYYVTGDTYARSEANGEDEFFQFIINKAKVQSENTITLEAEGDPSVFNMSLRVMRPAGNKPMMQLVKYDLAQVTPAGSDTEGNS